MEKRALLFVLQYWFTLALVYIFFQYTLGEFRHFARFMAGEREHATTTKWLLTIGYNL